MVSRMHAGRPLLGSPAQLTRSAPPPLPGYLCERCQDAPAVQWQPAPWGGEMGVCTACRTPPGGAAEEKPARRRSQVDGLVLADPPEDDTP